MKFKIGPFEIPPKKTTEQKNEDLKPLLPTGDDTLENNLKVIIPVDEQQEPFIKIPLLEEELKMSTVDLAKKYGYTHGGAQFVKEKGFRSVRNPNFISDAFLNKENKENIKKYIEEITQIPIVSIETAIGNEKEQKEIKKIVDIYNQYKYHTKDIGKEKIESKKFKLLNGQELFFGDFVVLDRMIDLKMFRNNDGLLMMFDEEKNDFIEFKQSSFFKKSRNKGFVFRNNFNQPKNPKRQREIISLESFSPTVFKLGFFKEEDFGKRLAGTATYDTHGPHERMISKFKPNVSLSNSIGRCSYYIGREKFVGTNEEINHETVRASILDDSTGVITDIVNGRKVILYTFPLIKKEEYEIKKSEIVKRRLLENKSIDKKGIDDNIITRAFLKKYSILNYIPKYDKESDVDYNNRISKLSDTSYVLGNFRSFMSETGLAANNYSWREQLILADALTSVHDKNKILDLGKNFGKDGIRTFISIEQGEKGKEKEMGDKILKLGDSKKFGKDMARKVFAKYGEIIDVADKAEEEVKKLYEKDNIPNGVFISIKNTLLKRGADLLSSLADGLDDNVKVEEDYIINILEDIKTSTIIMGQSYVELYKEGIKISIEEIKDTTLEKIQADSLSEKEKQELVKVYENGRPKETYENKEHLKLLTEEFKKNLENKDTFVFNIRLGGELIAFATFYKENEETLHIGGLTFIDDVRNPAIGEAVMNSIMKEFGNFNIKALVHSENKVLRMYQKRFGFEITKELPREENAGELYYEIERPKNMKEEKTIGEKKELKIAA